ncbi:MAG TPA: ATP-binding protein [Cellulomonas sp.]
MGEVRDLSSARSAHGYAADHELTLRAEPAAARVARHWVMRVVAAAGIGGAVNQLIEVLTAELVADAVRLGDVEGDAEGRVRIWLRIGADDVRVAVSGPRLKLPAPATTTSLALVEVLSNAWGTWPLPDGERTVWFDVETAG